MNTRHTAVNSATRAMVRPVLPLMAVPRRVVAAGASGRGQARRRAAGIADSRRFRISLGDGEVVRDTPGSRYRDWARTSRPVPKPVSVTRYFTGKFLLTSGSEPQLGLPPGPPVALTIGRLSG